MTGYWVPFTFEEKQKIEILLKLGKNASQISKEISRSISGIYKEIKKGGGKNYTAEESERIKNENIQKVKKGINEHNKKHGNFKIKKRIENLEMQVEILHEALKELMKK